LDVKIAADNDLILEKFTSFLWSKLCTNGDGHASVFSPETESLP
jgi:hypothetical protein